MASMIGSERIERMRILSPHWFSTWKESAGGSIADARTQCSYEGSFGVNVTCSSVRVVCRESETKASAKNVPIVSFGEMGLVELREQDKRIDPAPETTV